MSVPAFSDFEPLITTEELQARTAELGRQITAEMRDSSNVVVVCVLKGAVVFMADLIRHLPQDVTCDFLRLSSYHGGTRSTGRVRFDFDMTQPIEDRDVLIIEDIVDTGLSMSFLLKTLQARRPRSLRMCTLLHKPARQQAEVPLSYVGFTIPDRFVIGYGLDLEGRYRNLPYVAALREEVQADLLPRVDE